MQLRVTACTFAITNTLIDNALLIQILLVVITFARDLSSILKWVGI